MTYTEPGTIGAKRQSYRTPNPRTMLLQMMEQNRGKSESALLDLFMEQVKEDDDCLGVIIEYWFTNNYRSLRQQQRSPVERQRVQQQTVAMTEAVTQRIKQRIRQEAEIMLLDMILPNGKPLRECTGRECARLGPKIGGWLTSVAKAVKPDQVVGESLSERDVQRLYSKATRAKPPAK